MHDTHLVNLLGAGSLAIADLIDTSVAETAHTSRSGASALAVLLQAGPLSATVVGRRIGLSQPAAARMVDTLEQAGLVHRRPGRGREILVDLTGPGQASARLILRNRSSRLAGLLEGLSEDEQQSLSTLMGKVLTNVYGLVQDADRICRLCDRHECVSTVARCPVGLAAGDPPGA